MRYDNVREDPKDSGKKVGWDLVRVEKLRPAPRGVDAEHGRVAAVEVDKTRREVAELMPEHVIIGVVDEEGTVKRLGLLRAGS